MTNTMAAQTKTPLGIGSIISESFSILFRNFVPVVVLALVPTILSFVISGLFSGFGVVLGLQDPSFNGGGQVLGSVISIVVQLVFASLATALIVLLAYDAKLGRSISIGKYVSPALAGLVPLSLQSLAAGLLAGIGFVLFVIPGLWVYAVYSVIAAVVVIEKAGFGAMGRSAELTKEYRWPIVGLIVVLGLISFAVSFVAMFVVGAAFAGNEGNGVFLTIGMLVLSLITAVGTGLTSIGAALVYARLREIKEGATVSDIAAVFE